MATNITDSFKDIFLAGIGAMAMGAEQSKKVVDSLIEKGQLTVDQGKQINSELIHKATDATEAVREDVLAASMATMSQAEKEAFAAKVAELAKADTGDAAKAADADDAKAADDAQ